MRALLPYLTLYKRHKWMLTLGIVLAIVTLLASIGLLTLSGWFLSASAVVGVTGIYSFNYMLPAAGVRGGNHPHRGPLFRAIGQPRRDVPRAATFAYIYLQQTAAALFCWPVPLWTR